MLILSLYYQKELILKHGKITLNNQKIMVCIKHRSSLNKYYKKRCRSLNKLLPFCKTIVRKTRIDTNIVHPSELTGQLIRFRFGKMGVWGGGSDRILATRDI